MNLKFISFYWAKYIYVQIQVETCDEINSFLSVIKQCICPLFFPWSFFWKSTSIVWEFHNFSNRSSKIFENCKGFSLCFFFYFQDQITSNFLDEHWNYPNRFEASVCLLEKLWNSQIFQIFASTFLNNFVYFSQFSINGN